MKKRNLLTILCGLALLCAPAAWGQKKPKISKKEAAAINDVLKTTTPDARIAAVENVLTNYSDTIYKNALLQMGMEAAQQKGDMALMQTYADRLLESDPKNIFATVDMASQLAAHTREFDLDKDEKLAKAEKYAKETLENAPDFPKPITVNATDEQWEQQKKSVEAEAHIALGLIAMTRKNYDGAVTEYKASLAILDDPNTTFRLGQAYAKAGKLDEAKAEYDKVLSMPNASDLVKKYAQAGKAELAKEKGPAPK